MPSWVGWRLPPAVPPLERALAAACVRWCRLVARHPWPFIVLPLLSTAALSTGLFWRFRVVRGVNYLYSALEAPWKREQRVLLAHWANTDQRFYPGRDALLRPGLFIIGTARDNGSVLRPAHALQMRQFIDWLVTVPLKWPNSGGHHSNSSSRHFTYSDVCLHFPPGQCFANGGARLVAQMFASPHNATVSFPSFRVPLGMESNSAAAALDLASTLGGAELTAGGTLLGARAWMLCFQLRQQPSESVLLSSEFEQRVSELIRRGKAPAPLLNLAYYHSGTFDLELAENAVQLAPKFAVTFALLVLFAILCSFDLLWVPVPVPFSRSQLHLPAVDWAKSKPLVGLAGVLSTLMAIASATGALLWAGVTFVDMCSVMPFLSLTIGIDDTFLMLAAWRSTSAALPMYDRIERSMRHAAVSITITSLTDALAFLIGSIAPLPAVIYFCYYSALAILFIYAHFMTMFVAVLAIQGSWEERQRHCLFGCRTVPVVADVALRHRRSLFHSLLQSGSSSSSTTLSSSCPSAAEPEQRQHWSQRFFASLFVPFIAHWAVQLVAFAALCAYVALATVGVHQLTIGFKLINIVSFDHRVRHFLELRTELFAADVNRLDIAVLRPPNLGSLAQREPFLRAVAEFEQLGQCTLGGEGTEFWWRRWHSEALRNGHNQSFANMDLDPKTFLSTLRPFLRANPAFDYDILRSSQQDGIRAFRFSVQLRPFPNDLALLECARRIRAICAKHSKYALSSYSPLWNLADQFEIIWPQTMQDLYISVGVMMFVSLLIIPRPFCAFVVALNILSIGFGVIGFMPYWGVNLDATSMITIAMSVGFSVDFAAHITYAYISIAEGADKLGGEREPLECLRGALASVGWPISQASLSVLIGIFPLATIDTWIIQTCFKTCFLVILFGWVHALVFLPLALMHCHRLALLWPAGRRRRQPPNVFFVLGHQQFRNTNK